MTTRNYVKNNQKTIPFIRILVLLYLAIVISLLIGINIYVFFVSFILVLLFLYYGLHLLKEKSISLSSIPHNTYNIKQKRVFSGVCFSIIFVSSLLYWLAYYPGGFNLDAYGQWEQAHGTMLYSDWHPILSTLIIKACILLVDSFSFCIAVQILLFSLSCTLVLCTLLSYGIKKNTLIAVAFFIGINPAIGLNTVSMIKDVHFTIIILLFTNSIIKIYFSDGTYLSKKAHQLLVAVLGSLICLVRHNGFLYVAPAFIVLAIQYLNQRKRICAISIVTICIILLVKGPIYKSMNVSKHENPIGEAIGIPMAVMVNALVNDSDNIPNDVHEFLNTIASDETWSNLYVLGEWDSCKWELGGTELLKDISIKQIVDLTIKTIVACPEAAYESVRANTSIVWKPIGTNSEWMYEPYIEDNDWRISPNHNEFAYSIIQFIEKISFIFPFSTFLWNTGFCIVAMLLAVCNKKKLGECIVLPIIIFDVGTMLLLSGPNQRYFYCNAVLLFPLVLAILYKQENT